MARPGTDEFRDDVRTLIPGTMEHARAERVAHAREWYAGTDLLGDLERALTCAEKRGE